MIQSAAFYTISGLLILSALMVVIHRNLFVCALYLAGALSMVAGLFILLGADFLAAVQILLYVGGIVVIIVFAVMLSSAEQTKLQPQANEQWLPSIVTCLLIFTVMMITLNKNPFAGKEAASLPTTHSIGRLLLVDMKLPFETVSLILIVSLVGAVIFSRRVKEKEEE